MTDFIRLEPSSRPGGPAGPGSGLLTRLLGMLAGMVVLAAAFVASAVLMTVLLALGAVAFGWFWWQTRAMRRAIRERRDDARHAGDVDDPRRGRDASELRRPRHADDISDARILREDPLEDQGLRR